MAWSAEDEAMVRAALAGGAATAPRAANPFILQTAPQADPLARLASEDPRAEVARLRREGVAGEAPLALSLPSAAAPALPAATRPAAAPSRRAGAPRAPAPRAGVSPEVAAALAPAPRRAPVKLGQTVEEMLEQFRGPIPDAPPAEPVEGIPVEERLTVAGSEPAPVPVVPGLLPASEQRTVAPKMAPASAEDYRASREREEQAAEEVAFEENVLASEKNRAMAGGIAKQARIEAEYAAKEADLARARETELARLQQAHQAVVKELDEQDIEAPSYWTGDTGTDILRGIGLFMAGIGGADTRKIINDKIDRDLAVQQARIQNARGKVDTHGLLLDKTRSIYASDEAALLAAKAASLQKVENEVGRFVTFAAAPAEQARGRLLLEQLQQERLKADYALEAAQADDVVRMYAPPAPEQRGSGAASARSALEEETKNLEAYNKWMDAQGLKREHYIPAAGGYALKESDVEKLKSGGAAMNTLLAGVGKLRRIAADGAMPLSEKEATYEAILQDTLLAKNQAAAAGTLDKSSLELYAKMLPSVQVLGSGNAVARLDAVADAARVKFQNDLIGRGLLVGPAPPNLKDFSAPASAEAD